MKTKTIQLQLRITEYVDLPKDTYDARYEAHLSIPGHPGLQLDGNSLYELFRVLGKEVKSRLKSVEVAQ